MVDKIKKFLRTLDSKTKSKLKNKIKEVIINPRNARNIKPMQNWGKDVYRLRVGKIRVIYKVTGNEVTIIDIDYRGNIY